MSDAAERGRLATAVWNGLDKAVGMQRPAVLAHVERTRRRLPAATPTELIADLERQYLAAVATMGAAAGGAAAVPGVGTGLSMAVGITEIGTFLEVTTLYTLAVAEVHGVAVDDLERRRSLVLAVLLGNSGAAIVERAAGRSGAHWGRLLVQSIPADRITMINKLLGRRLITKYGGTQGALVLGRALPFGIGAAVGATGNVALGYASIKAARRAFGPAPAELTPPEVVRAIAVRQDRPAP